eukprot:280126-Amphidinium_carterae.1
MHLMRAYPLEALEPHLERVDCAQARTLAQLTQQASLSSLQWRVATLPARCGGLGLTSLRHTHPIARTACLYNASTAGLPGRAYTQWTAAE